MPASMIMALAGFMRNVSGSSMAIVAGGPSPGMMPTMVPRNTPTKHQNRFTGCSASANPCSRPPKISTSGKRHAEREDEIEAGRDAERDERGDARRPAVHHRDDEEAQHRKADEETDDLQHRARDGERSPGRKCAAGAFPLDLLVLLLRENQDKGEREHR